MAKLDYDDKVSNPSDNPSFGDVVRTRISRRGFIGAGIATGVAASLGGVGSLVQGVPKIGTEHQ